MMATEKSIDEIIELAASMFPEEIVETLKRARFTMEDLHNLTREDIDVEFREFRFGVRKTLWMFLAAFIPKEVKNARARSRDSSGLFTTAVQILPVQQTSHMEESVTDTRIDVPEIVLTAVDGYESNEYSGHDDNFEEDESFGTHEEIVQQSDTQPELDTTQNEKTKEQTNSFRAGARPKAKSKKKLHRASMRAAPAEVAYPCHIPTPFPLSASSKEFLANDKDFIYNNEHQLHHVIRDVCEVMWKHLGRRPLLSDIKTVEERLHQEYPVLYSKPDKRSSMLYRRLRKRINGLARKQITGSWHGTPNSRKEQLWRKPRKARANLRLSEPYPGNIPIPFPLSECSKTSLTSGREYLSQNKYRYHFVIKEVCDVMWSSLKRKPTIKELRTVEKNLTLEYPALRSDTSQLTDSLFYQRLRKRANGVVRSQIKNAQRNSSKQGLSMGKDTYSMNDADEETTVATRAISGYHDEGPRTQQGSSRPAQKSRHLDQYLQPPTTFLDVNDQEAYPGRISTPFPLSDTSREFLTSNTRESFVEMRVIYLAMVREVASLLHRNLDRMPLKSELDTVAKNLCIEYPILQCYGKYNYSAFLVSLRRRMHRYKELVGDESEEDEIKFIPRKKARYGKVTRLKVAQVKVKTKKSHRRR